MGCPNCGSTEWKSADLVHKEGVSSTDTDGKLKGYGISTGGIGIARGEIKAKSQTMSELSKLAAPPPVYMEPSIYVLLGLVFALIGILLIWFGNALGWFGDGFVFFGWISLAGGVLGALYPVFNPEEFTDKEREKYRVRSELWSKKRMCSRCGTFYVDNSEKNIGNFVTKSRSLNDSLRKKYPY